MSKKIKNVHATYSADEAAGQEKMGYAMYPQKTLKSKSKLAKLQTHEMLRHSKQAIQRLQCVFPSKRM